MGSPGDSDSRASACNAGDPGWISGSRRCPGEGNGNSFQCSCLEIPWAEEPGGLQSMDMTERLTLSLSEAHELDIYCLLV